MKYKYTIVVLVFFILSVHTNAFTQDAPKFIGGNSLGILIPGGDLEETYTVGLGFYAHLDYNMNKIFALRLDLGWNDIVGEETEYTDSEGKIRVNHPERTVWEITAGVRAKYSFMYIEGRGGYFFGLNEFGYVPAAGIRFWKIDLQGNYAFAGDNEYAAVRIAYYWTK